MPEKMTVSAVICELNPLHGGHMSLLGQAREGPGALVCVLSGHFVQRGEPAILDKWARARLALEAGADLVAELPLPWSCAGAERFARGGVALAAGLGAGRLVFGSECPDTVALVQIARALLSDPFKERLAALPEDGSTFARKRQQALGQLLGPEAASLLGKPNALLGVEYCKAILSMGLGIEPMAVRRTGAGHDQPGSPGVSPSASQLRAMLLAGESLEGWVPACTQAVIQEEKGLGRCPASLAYGERAVLSRLRAMGPGDFAQLPDVSEGLENRLYKAARQACSLEEFYALAKSKRTTHARLRRLALGAFLGLHAQLPPLPPYVRVLGMTAVGAGLLKQCCLPVALRAGDFARLPAAAQGVFMLEVRAGDLYGLCCPRVQPCGRDFTQGVLKG